MHALRYLDCVDLWSETLRTDDEVVKSENREVLQFLLTRPAPQGIPGDMPPQIAGYAAYLLERAAFQPEIPAEQLQPEFEKLILQLRKDVARRKLAERAARLSDGRSREVEIGAVDELASLHIHQSELNRRTLLSTRQ